MRGRDAAFLAFLAAGACALGTTVFAPKVGPLESLATAKNAANASDLRDVISQIDAAFRRSWNQVGLQPAPPAHDLAVMRRVSLGLMGSIPSLEEIRRFESTPRERRVDAWVDTLLKDRRTADYLAERIARVLVGTEDGPFVLFRRRRLTTWLSDAIHANRPYDEVVRDLISERGIWTDHPATNFVTVTIDQQTQRPDPERLAARVSRAFLGIRLDCAQCHDHPFQPWKQSEFRGLAAFFGGAHADLRGVRDETVDYSPLDAATAKPVPVDPCVPFLTELLPPDGSARSRLAAWVTDENNAQLSRVTVNRIWALLYGRPLCEPIDDLPPDAEQPEALKLAAADFASHGFDLHRLIRLLSRCETFRLDSGTVEDESSPSADDAVEWAAFPITRLRPEQVAGSLFQCASITSIGPDAFWFVRLLAFTGRNEFVRRYGDVGEDEFEDRSGTISQRLLLLNGDLVKSTTADGIYSAVSRIASQASTSEKAVEAAYLAVLTRRPTPDESAHFQKQLDEKRGDARTQAVSDLYWTLINSTEFSWNH